MTTDNDSLLPSALSQNRQSRFRAVAAYEVKFLLRSAQAERAQTWARQHLVLDPHADPALGGYRIRSVYFDTDAFDVARQTPSYRRRKFRLRRYGDEDSVFLESKLKSGDRVSKRRTQVADADLARLHGDATAAWAGAWFQRRLRARAFKPRCLVTYERLAHVGMSLEGPIRLTMDRDVRCALTERWDFTTATPGTVLLGEQVVLELKFRTALPAVFKRLIEELALNATGVSKYRLGIQAWGLTPGTGKLADVIPA